MALLVLLNATLRRYRPDYDAGVGISLEVEPGTTVAQILPSLRVPAQEVSLVMIDGRRRELDFVLQGNERVALFPPIGGG
jgi:molybdopterin synthase sulfur carrier subunit